MGNDYELKLDLIKRFNESEIGSYSDIHATNQRLSIVVYWKGMQSSIHRFLRSLHVCCDNPKLFRRCNLFRP